MNDRWIDTLPEVGDYQSEFHAKYALGLLYSAITFVSPDVRLEKAQLAAAHIIAWRGTLGGESRRYDYDGSLTGNALLWCAVKHVATAAMVSNDVGTAADLRYAELVLREYWEANK